MKYPTLKKRWPVIVAVVVLPLFVCIIWLFQSHSPTKKVYTSDRQYSYYLEEYNYNDILKKILGSWLYRTTNYKVFIFDEKIGRRVYSGDAGEEQLWENWFGFEEEFLINQEGDRVWFHFNKFDYFELPGSKERQAAFMEQRRLRAVKDSIRQEELKIRNTRDSIRWEYKRAEAQQLFRQQRDESPITGKEKAYIQPVIQKWLDFYSIDLSQARQAGVIEGICITCQRDSTDDPYYWKFGPKDDSRSLVQMSYSPNKQRYVDMMIDIEIRDDMWYDTGMYDVDQQLYLVDRRKKIKNCLVYNGPSVRVEDIFWKGNDVFIMVGFSYFDVLLFRIDVYDIPARTHKTYEVLFEGDPKTLQDLFGSYHNEVYLPSRGIVPYKQ